MGKDVSKYTWHRVLHGPDLDRNPWIYAPRVGIESYRDATKEGLHSIRLYKEYDCKKEMGHFRKYVAHTGPQATGEVMGNVETPSDWKTVNSSPANKLVFSQVCKDYKP